MPVVRLFACCVVVICLSLLTRFSWACRIPYYCTCHGATNQYKISCDGRDVVVRDRPHFDRFLAEIPPGVKTLNVSGFSFGKLSPNAFQNLSGLKVLKLRDNQITDVSSTTFVGLSELRRLDLSANGLKGLPQDTFLPLPRLERVDLSENLLKCDCALKWLWDWGQRKSGATTNWPVKGTCEGGGSLQEKSRSDFDFCPRKLEVADLMTYPRKRQLTFAGDATILTCIAIPLKTDADIVLFWVKNGAPVNESFEAVHIKRLQTKNELRTDLEITRLGPPHDGEWVCVANSSLGIETREVTLRVVSDQTSYCSDIMTETNKGRFAWPLTLSSSRVSLPCSYHDGFAPEPVPGSSLADAIEDRGAVVWHECGRKGAWEELDDAACPYVSVTTKILEQFADAEINLPTEDSALKSVKYLRNYTMNTTVITDPVDIVFIGRTIEKYLSYVSSLPKYNRELAAELIEIAAIIQGLGNGKLLHEAQFTTGHGRTLSRIVHSVEQIPRLIPDFYHDGMRISVSSQPVEAANFMGMQCRWLDTKDGVHREIRRKPHRTFDGEPNGITSWEESEVEDDGILATISIPSEILSPDVLGKQLVRLTHTQWPQRADFGGLASSYGWGSSRPGDFWKHQRFDFLGFDSSALFLDAVIDDAAGSSRREHHGARVVAGPVFGCKMSPFPSTGTDPKTTIDVTLRLPFEILPSLAREVVTRAQRDRGDGSMPLPPLAGAIWNDTEAMWDVGAPHCTVTGIRGHVVFLSCKRCGYYGVSVDEKFFAKLEPGGGGHQRHPHPFVFIGSNLGAGCLLVTLGVYVALSKRLALNNPQKHCLANTWVSMALLMSLYCGGIYQTGNSQLCQGVGLLLHFFVQASVMWMINSLSYLKTMVQIPYKAAASSEEEAAAGDNPGDPRHPGDQEGKLISQMYLLAYGVALLICCLSAAVHVKEYGGPYVCTLSWRPTVWAILVPLVFAVVVLWVLYMSVCCTLQCGVVPATASGPLGEEWTPNREPDQLDREYQSELNSHAIIFVLFAATVIFAALAVTNDVQSEEEDKDDTYRAVWAASYCLPSAALGIFVLIRFAFQKIDFGLELEEKKSVLLLPTPPPAQSSVLPPPASSIVAPSEEPIAVNGSSSSARTGDPRVVSVGVPGTAVVTRSLVSAEGFAPSGPVPAPLPMAAPAPVVVSNPIFYDPQQMSVAKRFFEKQRRKQQKQQFAAAVGAAAAAGSGADSWIEPRRHHPPPLSSVMGSESELYMHGGLHDGDETESHFTSVSNQRPNSGGHRMCKWSDSEVSVPCRPTRTRWGSGGHGSGVGGAGGGGGVHYGAKQHKWPRRQRRNDSCSSRGGMEMEPLVTKQRAGMIPHAGLYQQERVVIGQESAHGIPVGGMPSHPVKPGPLTSSTAPPSDVLLPDVDSEDGLSLMRPLQSLTSPSRSVVSDATCATFNSSNVAACRLRSLDLNGQGHSHGVVHGTMGSNNGSGEAGGSIAPTEGGGRNDSVLSEGRRGIGEKRNETMSSLSSCSTGSCQNKRETCI